MDTEQVIEKCEEIIDSISVDKSKKYVEIKFGDIISVDPELAEFVESNFEEFIKSLNHVFMKSIKYEDFIPQFMITDLPKSMQYPIGEIRKERIGKFGQYEGTVLRTGEVRVVKSIIRWECPACGQIISTLQGLNGSEQIKKPKTCGCGRKGGFKEISCEWKNIQYIVVEEYIKDFTEKKTRPTTIRVLLEEELTDEKLTKKIQPGKHIIFTGTIVAKQDIKKTLYHSFNIVASHVKIEELSLFNLNVPKHFIEKFKSMDKKTVIKDISKSLFHNIEGQDIIKEILAVSRARAVKTYHPDGKVDMRDTIYPLLIGDPGGAKSDLAKQAIKIELTWIVVSGKASSGVGITAAVVRDPDLGSYCIYSEQYVCTDNGIKKIKDIKPYDKVFTLNEKSNEINTNMVKHVSYNGKKQIYDINLKSGDTIQATYDHNIMTKDGWKLVKDLTTKDYTCIPVISNTSNNIIEKDYELGFFYGFALCDIYIDETRLTKYKLGFGASIINQQRTEKIKTIINNIYNIDINKYKYKIHEQEQVIGNRVAKFTEREQYYFSNKRIYQDIKKLFDNNMLPKNTYSFYIGFLSSILSTDTCITNIKVNNRIKPRIIITPTRNRKKTNINKKAEWNRSKLILINSIFHRLGIFSRIKSNRILITEISSYDKICTLIKPYMVGKNKSKLVKINERKQMMSSIDLVDNEYFNWFIGIKFHNLKMYGLFDLYYKIKKRGYIYKSQINRFVKYWTYITDDPFKEYKTKVIYNKITKITNKGEESVYDLTIDENPNFLVNGGIVHNCVEPGAIVRTSGHSMFLDELDKVDDSNLASLNEAMTNLSFTIAKANQLLTLPADTNLIGALNPDGRRWDAFTPRFKQIPLKADFLDRFDIWVAVDKIIDPEKQKKVISKIINRFNPDNASIAVYNMEYIRYYYAWIIQTFKPTLDDKVVDYAMEKINKLMNQTNSGDNTREVSFRLVGNIVRFAIAISKMRQEHEVTNESIDLAISYQMYGFRSLDMIDEDSGLLSYEKLNFQTPTEEKKKKYSPIDIIKKLHEELKRPVRFDEIYDKYKEIYPNDTDDELDSILDKLKLRGDIFEPKPGQFNPI